MDTIKHIGKVVKIQGNEAFVELDEMISCTGCQLQSACGVSEGKTKEFRIDNNNQIFQLGEAVQLSMHQNLGLKAVFFAYVIPFLILIGILLLSGIYFSEWVSGLLVFAGIGSYFFFLKWANPIIQNHFKIEIRKVSN